ncbi:MULTISPECIES: hypothetical protein [Streptomyces]|uniref:Uncharacterized protein n=1 Tax=Streptomyces koyangensis TaxID=188770 RepID=A0A385D7G5_9ACTN|nr:hypothetical protein [Streptomyces koyangensis]AXQ54343.1 hypothetical protein D0C37_06825 [Streptomyces koyangensis]KIX80013.1 hypothetical protein SF12_00490 [Streptomyces sp. MBRL 601]WTD05787.1 hypothetical protein OH717_26035 [Streptomyces albidoflavus]
MAGKTRRLTLRIVVPDARRRGAAVEVRQLVDGEDLLAGAFTEDRPWLQSRLKLLVSGEDPTLQAARLAGRLVAGDPRRTAEVCGGSPEFARQLGYSWPRRPSP